MRKYLGFYKYKRIFEPTAEFINISNYLAKTNLQRHEAWEQHMREFVPDDMLNFMVPGGAAIVFHETINH